MTAPPCAGPIPPRPRPSGAGGGCARRARTETRSSGKGDTRTGAEPGRRDDLLRARDGHAPGPDEARDLPRVRPPVSGHERHDRRTVAHEHEGLDDLAERAADRVGGLGGGRCLGPELLEPRLRARLAQERGDPLDGLRPLHQYRPGTRRHRTGPRSRHRPDTPRGGDAPRRPSSPPTGRRAPPSGRARRARRTATIRRRRGSRPSRPGGERPRTGRTRRAPRPRPAWGTGSAPHRAPSRTRPPPRAPAIAITAPTTERIPRAPEGHSGGITTAAMTRMINANCATTQPPPRPLIRARRSGRCRSPSRAARRPAPSSRACRSRRPSAPPRPPWCARPPCSRC